MEQNFSSNHATKRDSASAYSLMPVQINQWNLVSKYIIAPVNKINLFGNGNFISAPVVLLFA